MADREHRNASRSCLCRYVNCYAHHLRITLHFTMNIDLKLICYLNHLQRLKYLNTSNSRTDEWTFYRAILRQHCSEDGPAGRAKCSWGRPVRGDEIVSIGDKEIRRMTRVECVETLKGWYNRCHFGKNLHLHLN